MSAASQPWCYLRPGNPSSLGHPRHCPVFGVPAAPPNCDKHASADVVTCPLEGFPPPCKLLIWGESTKRCIVFSGEA